MTFIGFSQEDIRAGMDKINKTVEELENMTEEERKENLKSWEDVKKELGIDEEEDGKE